MLVWCALVSVGIGLIIGRLYPAVSLLIVSPLLGAVAAAAASSDGRTIWHAALFGLAAIFLFQLSFLGGVRLRSVSPRSGAAEPVVPPPSASSDAIVRIKRSR